MENNSKLGTQDDLQEEQRISPPPFRLRIIWPIIQSAGLVPLTISFVGLFFIASAVVVVAEPTISNFGDAMWLMFQVVTTIGLGDFTCTTLVARVAAVVLSLFSLFFLAIITGVVVSYCQERMRLRRNQSVAHFIDQLEHLPELSQQELADLSEKVKRFERKGLR